VMTRADFAVWLGVLAWFTLSVVAWFEVAL
jgi:hypothetical protein